MSHYFKGTTSEVCPLLLGFYYLFVFLVNNMLNLFISSLAKINLLNAINMLIFVLGQFDYETIPSKEGATILTLSQFAADRISPKNFR